MAKIVLARIDDRLIHGQVMTAWLQYTGGNHIIIVDDQTAGDEFTKTIIKMAVPMGIGLDILTTTEAPTIINALSDDKKIIILTKGPSTYVSLIENGVSITDVIIGGMGANKNRSKFYKNISASEQEKTEFRAIISHNVGLKVHVIPDEKSVAVGNLL
ncbi:PTS sugar transporter subunit IIB [Vagococcus sp. BWB3-3]|uniref:PTS sugar transporter subunit IIB n=1 Tax=Vagococcus allomyrinae TaxID=2794353 RepID=A0A940STZ4_9ENTE|nr:PTS sugar transporter subunit IIB [Vagococcus allomyrinae]MBP1039566.1 PTS sugar transporter subunit IIB [Vagococcus allomyrinae]